VIVGEGGVGHASVPEEILLGEGVADAVECAAFGLAFAEGRVDGCSTINGGDVVQHADLSGPGVDFDFGEMGREGRGRFLREVGTGSDDLVLVFLIEGIAGDFAVGDLFGAILVQHFGV